MPPKSEADRVKAYKRRWKTLLGKREKMQALWRELRDNVNPERFEFEDEARTAGDNLYAGIYNNSPLLAANTEASGLMTHHTSPSTLWFQLEIPGVTLKELTQEERTWLVKVQLVYMLMFARSNVYTRMLELYEDLVTPGTGVFFLEEDREDGLRGWVLPCGTYCLAVGANGRVNTLYRWLKMTVNQMVEKFGYEVCSAKVREIFDRGEGDLERKILHVVEPRTVRDPEMVDSKSMPWSSLWMELEGSDTEGLLKESGYRSCPFMAPRWSVFGSDAYGRSPAMRALGDSKELQALELEKAKIVQKISRPPMSGPTELEARSIDLTPDGFTGIAGDGRLSAAYVPDRAALAEIRQDIALAERRIDRAFNADLFRLLVDDERSNNKTAEEIKAKSQERLMQIGPVVDRLNDEWLDPFFDRVFDIASEMRLLPEAPESLQGREVRVTYISVLASAQRMLRTVGLERLVGFTLQLAQVDPAAVKTLSADRIVSLYAEMVGADPRALKTEAETAAEEQAQQQMMQQQAQAEQAQMASQAAKNLGQTPMSKDNALGALLGAMGPVAGAADPAAAL